MYETGDEFRQMSVRFLSKQKSFIGLTLVTYFLNIFKKHWGTQNPGGNVANDVPDFYDTGILNINYFLGKYTKQVV